jgi:hypothetical protein
MSAGGKGYEEIEDEVVRPSDWHKRLLQEKQELDLKRDRLYRFLSTDTFQKLPDPQKNLLQRQHDAMTEYSYILMQRIVNL